MATPVIMPRQGQSVESCIIGKWHKNVGDKVNVGDILFTYETDKSTFDEEAKVEGTMLAIFFEEGDDVECLLNVCVIGNEGESVDEFKPAGEAEEEAAAVEVKAEETVVSETVEATPAVAASIDGVFVSPRAKALADKTGADLRFAVPTGANGRIISNDVEKVLSEGHTVSAAAKAEYDAMGGSVAGTGINGKITTADLSAPKAAPAAAVAADEPLYVEEPISNIRKVIAKAMHASLSEMAQLTLNTSFDATEIMAYRKKLKASSEALGLPNITLNDIIIYAASRALMKFDKINANFTGEKLLKFTHANIGIAVDTERGLMVPTLNNADKKTLAEISAEAKELAGACKGGSVSPDLLKGASFTISNLGSMGIESFTPVINPPQTAILGVCGITERSKNGVFYPAMGLSLTIDHRIIDGADGARFLKELANILENFSVMLCK